MQQIIRDGAVVDDAWVVVSTPEQLSAALETTASIFLTLDIWQEHGQSIDAEVELGVLLEPGQEPGQIAESLGRFASIAVNFPVFTDGRGFSYARELRQTHNFPGEIRAVGAMIRDQLHYLTRSGFNAFQFDTDTDLNAALGSFNAFTNAYQACADATEPLFRRRSQLTDT
ncbi:MAG: hypothetical protein ACI9GW_001592 [Halieaceae bacterium]|jgi:uncharacterized protein (DUF934 family)